MEDYMLPCLNKKLFGLECLGCGFQRATAFLFSGNFMAAFKMYPAVFTLWILGIFILASLFFNFKYARIIKISLILINAVIIIVSYIYKVSFLF